MRGKGRCREKKEREERNRERLWGPERERKILGEREIVKDREGVREIYI